MYAVIVCPACRAHCQITETGKKTTKCQRCGAAVRMGTVRVWGLFENRIDAVTLRSAIQAQVSGPVYSDEFLMRATGSPGDESGKTEAGCGKTEAGCGKAEGADANVMPGRRIVVDAPEKPVREKKMNPDEIIRTVLSSGVMTAEECRLKCAEKGVDAETFRKMTDKMIDAGILYRPAKGYLALVP